MNYSAGNRAKCGRCGTRHGGNNHLCPVHGAVSAGCCAPRCNPAEWQRIYRQWNGTAREYDRPSLQAPAPGNNYGTHFGDIRVTIERK